MSYDWTEEQAYEEGLREAARERGLRRARQEDGSDSGAEKGRSGGGGVVRGQYRGAVTETDGGPFAARAATEELESQARLEWEREAALRAEFSNLAAYVAFRKAEASGRVKIMTKGTVVKV